MALIKCPECGKEVSERANACPVCGYPIADAKNFGRIRIKLGMYNGVGGTQPVTISKNNEIIWTGNSGQVAEIEINEPTDVNIKYDLVPMHYGGFVVGRIDPEKSNKYAVSIRQGFFKTVLTFQMVDIIDSE